MQLISWVKIVQLILFIDLLLLFLLFLLIWFKEQVIIDHSEITMLTPEFFILKYFQREVMYSYFQQGCEKYRFTGYQRSSVDLMLLKCDQWFQVRYYQVRYYLKFEYHLLEQFYFRYSPTYLHSSSCIMDLYKVNCKIYYTDTT